jgi:phosphate transport system substrate-binding protein
MKSKFYPVTLMFLLTALVLSACGPTATVTPTEVTTATDTPTEVTVTTEEPLSGTITVAGSSTVYPLSEAMAERFKNEGFAGDITIASVGSGAGFERFCVAGETDISNASRGIKDSEVESCAAIGRTPIEFRVGTDALAIVVSSTNEFLTDVTLEELGMIFSSRVQSWSDVRAEWPNQPIQRFSPGTDSGTFDYFVEEVMAKVNLNADGKADIEAGKKDILDASNIQFSEDDNVLVVGVEGSQYAIGYFGFAYYIENASRLKAISVDGVAPTAETAENGDYALARPLYIYSDAGILKDKPQVAAFIEFFLTYVNEEIEEVGYFPASEDALNVARQALQDALK